MSYVEWSGQIDAALCGQKVSGSQQTGDYEEVPQGIYHVAVNKLELKSSKKGFPMLAAQFKILNGDYKGRLIFMNTLLLRTGTDSDIGLVSRCNNFLRSLKCIHDSEVVLDQYGGPALYAKMVDRIYKELVEKSYTYALDYNAETAKNGNVYHSFTITDQFTDNN